MSGGSNLNVKGTTAKVASRYISMVISSQLRCHRINSQRVNDWIAKTTFEFTQPNKRTSKHFVNAIKVVLYCIQLCDEAIVKIQTVQFNIKTTAMMCHVTY